MKEVDDLLDLSLAVHWLLVNDFDPFPVDAVTGFGPVLTDRRCHIAPFAEEDHEMWVKTLKS